MKTLPWLLPLLLLTGCNRLDAIPAAPPQTAATWLTIQPYAAVERSDRELILCPTLDVQRQSGREGERLHAR